MMKFLRKNKKHSYELKTQTEVEKKSQGQANSSILRSDIINYLIEFIGSTDINYLEIGVRNPDDNFNKIHAINKFGVDPGIENELNPVEFKYTSDEFFNKMKKGFIFPEGKLFDVIFIDGLHLSFQAYKDILNALEILNEKGFIVIHDCNPPSEYHAREDAKYDHTPASIYWNGTTWKAFSKIRERKDLNTFCIDTDWGVGIISMRYGNSKPNTVNNPFFEFSIFEEKRKEILNLMTFEEFKKIISQ